MRQSLVASKLNRTVINRSGKNNSEQGPNLAVAALGHWNNQRLQRQAVDTLLGKGRRFVVEARRKSRDYVYKTRHRGVGHQSSKLSMTTME